ncbi:MULTISPECIES: phosphoribosylglycinamide formyltransferase [unclassified Photobacterium]|uniref:phosphoribosylglycinamide formyltransferase n=1 Tax=unclassified Photobacterium TaxID=2628852 RepID=UPI000D170555|nr:MULTISPECIES: phosphoribosylglycinamide formyltransferase [unclassified Photobacterium]PSV27879.1 phosphoribosylglycinamide formyltransferase [Photobacterium sp. GB-56]PSV31979.1 phosphoribosylglycinamide formyltransferase [Photobacterium sp. GB-72]PSV35416.1 phosphoribosylglycinamide formyltransferase [Photobacterium sp. GB-27]PSV36253.1 phosphoribosylglycinamide formyltransferase [Photobacterium sp. GB-210]PSV42166.1 phosphoribosylglycinamide formyltransferase [Photobacterium sp. GB-36]
MVVHTVARTHRLLPSAVSNDTIADAMFQHSKNSHNFKLINKTSVLFNSPHSIKELQQIPSWRQHNITQPYNQLEKLYQHAYPAQQELNMLLESAALASHSQAFLPGIKNQKRAEKKIATELLGNVNKLTDVVRGSVVATNISDLVKAYYYLAQYSDIVRVKNRFDSPAVSGYRDIKVLIRLSNSGLIAEIQLHLEAIAEIKNGEEHDIYEAIQNIERISIIKRRALDDIEKMQIKRLQEKSQALYAKAWQAYTQHFNLAS